MCIEYVLICISIIVLLCIIMNKYKYDKNMNNMMNNKEGFYNDGRIYGRDGGRVGGGGRAGGGGYGRVGGSLGHTGGGYRRHNHDGRGNYHKIDRSYRGVGGGGYNNYNSWWYPYFYGWYPEYDYNYNYNYYSNYNEDVPWRKCPQGTWCPKSLRCDDPSCL
jgi:hypothetical protein